ncbi:ATP-binding protein DrrA1-3 family domain-containing protein [Paenibacillus macerans]|uniref:ATP-binding protein DrrA1-3 family domain-containing protein n=1 Tax=Paenibacillus macerans TaxID=44252 RepID=UPI00398ACFD1
MQRRLALARALLTSPDSLADRIVIIDRGSVVASGSPQQLKERITDNAMALIFERENDARTAFVRLGGKCSAVLEANKVLVNVADKKTALRMLKSFDAENDGLISFEWKEPTLNDVFLHFTGRQLRN